MNIIKQIYGFLKTTTFLDIIIFCLLILLSIVVGQYINNILSLALRLFPPQQRKNLYDNLIRDNAISINRVGTWMLLYFSWVWLRKNEDLPILIDFCVDLIFIIFLLWSVSRIFRQLIKIYGVNLFGKIGGETTEILLGLETIFNIIVGLITFSIFAYQYGVPLTGLLAGVSISGLALSFAAQNTLQQLFGTVIIFLDKPFIQGEYIRLPDNDKTFGRVESIGLRSTKIRTVAKNTLLIVPNSTMANWPIENVTRGKKVMILVYFDFKRILDQYEKSLVKDINAKYIHSFFGVEPDTSSTTFLDDPKGHKSRARTIFFILGSTQSSIELRGRMVEVSTKQISLELKKYGIEFTANEPVISFDSPITL
ncbi:MAG: mechanosensitive ion channel [Crocosphaera sp.]|nr:mechanosensitive ion channel [Crocosphaera sp.]